MNWEKFNLGEDRLPSVAGVYAVYFDATLVYIGSSVDIKNRFSEHRIRPGYAKEIITPWARIAPDTNITVKVKRSMRRGDWAMNEIRLIHKLKPKFNRHHKKSRAA